MTSAGEKARVTSTWAPLRSPVYRALWIAQLVSNLGTWMQTVGAQWMLVGDPRAAVLVPLVQTATTLPVMLLALPSGVLADLIDRRRLLIATQGAMAAGVGLLATLTGAGLTTPTVLLTLLFVIGCGQALTAPAWQAIQPDLVPAEQIPAAAALGSMSINGARAIGPAIAGVLVSLSGPTLVFALNAVSFVGIVIVLVWWRRPAVEQAYPPERALAALSAGGRFIRSSPIVRRILLRAALFIAPGSAMWGLLPVIAANQLGLSSSGYGLLLGALGLGAVFGAFLLSPAAGAVRPERLADRRRRRLRGGHRGAGAGAQLRGRARRLGDRRRVVAAVAVDAQRLDAAEPAGVGARPRTVGVPADLHGRAGAGFGGVGCARRSHQQLHQPAGQCGAVGAVRAVVAVVAAAREDQQPRPDAVRRTGPSRR